VTRRERQGEILRLVRERPISTQSELVDALRAGGYDVVQTTVSRDVHELGLVKVRAPSGRLVYALPGTADRDRLRELQAGMRRWALSVEASGNLVLVLTPSGYANALAQVMDEAVHPDILGTVAGDNTILVVAREGVSGAALRDELREHLLEGAA
jgi:transcriptional regulator of arginine metabolism